MKVTATSDWRDAIPFETPVVVAQVVPGEPTRCSVCGGDSVLLPRTDLWAVKHRHPNHHAGFVRFYCATHLPVIAAPPSPPPERKRSAARAERQPIARRPAATDVPPRAMCADCYVEVSAKGVCGMCGTQVA
jgi:hypothetical protein